MKVPASAGNSWLVSWDEVFLFESTLEEGETVCVAVERSAFTGSALPLPVPPASTEQTDPCIQIRPYVAPSDDSDTTAIPFSWGSVDKHASKVLKDTSISKQALPPFSDFPLLTLGKTEELLSCQRLSTGSEYRETRWMQVESIGTPLSKQASFTPTVDWEIVAEAPITFCNLLPEPITLSIWSSDPPSTEALLKEDGLVLEPGAKKGISSVHPKGCLLVCLKIRDSWVPRDELENFFAPESAGADGGAVAAVQVDPMIRIDHLVVSGAHLKLTLEAAPTSRPAQLLGSWSSLVTAAGNTKRMPVRLSGATAESRRLRRSIFMEAVVRHVLRDLLHQSLRLLSGVDVLGVISSTLTALGHGASRLVHKEDTSNRHFQQALGNQLDNVGEGLLYGAEAMAKGVALGVADVLVRSRSGYETHGPPGLLLGLSNGLAGLVVHPVTGCLHSLAFFVAGVDASTASCARMVQRKPQLQRLRLPRAISADGVVQEYSKDSAVGQMVLFLAEAGSYFGKHDIFRDHSKFALSDAYVNHILLPNCRILLITSCRVMMLKCPVDPAGQPDSLALVQGPSLVRWDVPWDNLLALEIKCIPSFPRPVVCVHMREPTPQRLYTIIRCPESYPAEHVLAEVASAFDTYGPKQVNFEAAQVPNDIPHHSFLSTASSRSSLSLTTSSARPIQPTQSRRFGRQHSVRTSEAALAIGRRALSSSESNPLIMTRPLALSSTTSQSLPSHVETDTFIRAWVVEDGPTFCLSSCQRDAAEAGHFAIWKPVPPEGYVSLGDVAWRGLTPPPAVRVHSITPASLAAGSAKTFATPKDYFLVSGLR
ncbi:unnamed protein product [Closterium sp. Naga37s-1]|nr:unnamed protein product [Closterium sp. Naga37s-1]